MGQRPNRTGSVSTDDRSSGGFTLIELLIVVVILGVLATVVVFAVRGIVDQGEDSSAAGDERTLVTAEESYYARYNTYGRETDLVAGGFLRTVSELHDVTLTSDAGSYTIGLEGTGGGGPTLPPPPPPPPTTAPPPPTTAPPVGPIAIDYGGYAAQSLGSGSKKLVIIGTGTAAASNLFTALQATPIADTQVVWVNTADIDATADVTAIVGMGADYFVAAQAVQIDVTGQPGNTTYVGAFMATFMNSPDDFWWTQSLGQPTPANLSPHL